MDDPFTEFVDCRMCGASWRKARSIYGQIRKCPSCGLVYVTPQIPMEEMRARLRGSQYWNEEYLPSYAVVDLATRYAEPLEMMKPYFTGSHRLLDVGCGAGFFMAEARKHGWEVEGVEILPSAVEYARKEFNLKVHIGEIAELPLPDGHYDVITMWETIEHLQNPMAILEQVNRLLRPGGLLALSTPNFSSLVRLLIRYRWPSIGPGDHIIYFTPKTMTKMLRLNGFDPKRVATAELDTNVIRERTPFPLLRYLVGRGFVERNLREKAPLCGMGDVLFAYAEKRRTVSR